MQDHSSSMTDNSLQKLFKGQTLISSYFTSMSKEVTQVSVQSDSNQTQIEAQIQPKETAEVEQTSEQPSEQTITQQTTEAQVVSVQSDSNQTPNRRKVQLKTYTPTEPEGVFSFSTTEARYRRLIAAYPNNLSLTDNNDYDRYFKSIIKPVETLENKVQNPTVMVDFFLSNLPYVSTMISLQAIDEFIICCEPNLREQLYETLNDFRPYPLTYNWKEDENKRGSFSWNLSIVAPAGVAAHPFEIYPKLHYENNMHIITTAALEIPERIPDGEEVSIISVQANRVAMPLTVCKFTHSSRQFYQNLEFVFTGTAKMLLKKPEQTPITIFLSGYCEDEDNSDEEEEEEETSEDSDDIQFISIRKKH
ncbi:hypothetical protein TVAG_356700 [Trichomonas vaginalis G3]|uniref:Uncharacterized protein n=1 Tax=Trichomonas vaginalis (strain ATCC PRA-98 / G3) TaxID=412133 RepID=A2G9J3_TRIV3|nr:attachment subunit-related family [Trichomonas vaginalis G3]EAX86177.1 hypothetical protein TVAG_356700 [Trichomonas vaginalis G3]KAI5519606.1 attachment subunit-related family [Trichomonas vaginalis G3]|eukprot:XP_001299107.1 hypothetical protein [Trichomonas vaginalis G3]